MIFNLNEDNKDIDNLIKYIDNKIIELRTKKKLSPEVLLTLQEMYLDAVNEYLTYNYILGKEANENLEKMINEDLMDLLNYINKL